MEKRKGEIAKKCNKSFPELKDASLWINWALQVNAKKKKKKSPKPKTKSNKQENSNLGRHLASLGFRAPRVRRRP